MKNVFLLFMLSLSMSAYSQNDYNPEIAKEIDTTHRMDYNREIVKEIDSIYRHNPEIIKKVNSIYIRLPWHANYFIFANAFAHSRLRARAVYKDGTPAYPDSYKYARSNDPDDSIFASIVKNTLSADKLNELKATNESLDVLLIVEPDGSIAEVGFILDDKSLQLSIPVSTFYILEKQIKAKIHFTLDDKTKNIYRWIHDGLSIRFKDIE